MIKKNESSFPPLKPLFIIVFFYCVWIFLKVAFEFPYPETDVFLFKDPGANLFFKGGFFAVNLPYTSGKQLVHFLQGNLYPLFYGLWTIMVGFSFKKAIIFDSFIDLSRLILSYAYIAYSIHTAKKVKSALPFLLLLPIFFTIFHADRSDILATSLALASFIFILKFHRCQRNSPVVTGALLTSFCVFTAPAIGFFTLLIQLYCLWDSSERIKTCFIYLLTFGICSLLQIGVYLVFSLESLIRAADWYNRFCRAYGNTAASFLGNHWRNSFNCNFNSRFTHIFLWIQIGAGLIVYKWGKNPGVEPQDLRVNNSFFKGTLISVLLSYLFFPWEYNYLIFLSYLLTIYFIISFEIFPQRKIRGLLTLLLFLSFLIPAGRSAKDLIEALTRPRIQSSEFIEEKIYGIVPFGEKIATDPIHYYIVKKHYEPVNLDYILEGVFSYNYVLATENGIGTPGLAFFPISKESRKRLFEKYEVVFDYLNRSPIRILNLRISKSGYGFGGILLKKRGN